MMRRIILVGIALIAGYAGYGAWRMARPGREVKPVSRATSPDPSKDPVYVCPMDPDIRSNDPGNCSRCLISR